jgi:hypothetical protein
LAPVADENDYRVWGTLATFLEGVSLSGLGRTEEGLALTETAIDLYQGLTTPPVFWPQVLSIRGLVHALAGNPQRALALIDEAIAIGGPGDLDAPEFRILKGDFLRMLSEPELAESAYQSAVKGAGAIGLHLIELQALTRLVELRREMGRSPDRSEELAALYATFTEGFGERDLIAAKQVLG